MRVGAIEEDFSESRALVAIEAPAEQKRRPAMQRQSTFVAHLIATKDQHPQTRARRRAEPGDALKAYVATAALTRRA